MGRPKLSDPGGSPRFPRSPAGRVKRQPAIFEERQFGPWQCDVLVIPITGMHARAGTVFEVNVQWQRGPALDVSHGPAPPGGMRAMDLFIVDPTAPDLRLETAEAGELAIAIARRAVEILRSGAGKPDLPAIARNLRRRR